MPVTADQKERYSRQIRLEQIGEEGQQRLLESRAVIVGCGALGSFHAAALARAGVGEIVIIDRDYVEESNLQRQWLFDEQNAAEALPKAAAAAKQISRINSDVKTEARIADLTPVNAEELLLPSDVILDGTDNFETRYLVNEVAVKHDRPWVYGGAVGVGGAVMTVLPGQSACLCCIFPETPTGALPTCDTAGILNSASATVAALQVAEAIKIIVRPDQVQPRLTNIDVWTGVTRGFSTAHRADDCPVCSRGEFNLLESPASRKTAVLCGRDAVQVTGSGAIDLMQLERTLSPLGHVKANEYALRFDLPPHQMTIFADGRAIIKGVQDTAHARSLYSRYVGS